MPFLQVSYKEVLLTAEIPEEDDNYDSDFDPPFIPPAIPDPDLDYDEYSDGEIPEGKLTIDLAFYGLKSNRHFVFSLR